MKPKVIKTAGEYKATLARIEAIFDAKPGTAKGDELELLLLLVETMRTRRTPSTCPIRLRRCASGWSKKASSPRT
jgi:HTH-type transcriptional regulator / antitoxin HigA